MNSKEKIFQKYRTRGADYHWKEMRPWNPLAFNAYLFARYSIVSKALATIAGRREGAGGEPQSIADFGCGDGVQLHTIRSAFTEEPAHLFGIDLSKEATETARRKIPSADIRVASTYDSGFPSESFDISLSSDVIEHVLEPERMIDEMVRTTKSGGFILIATPIRYTEKPLDTMHVGEFFPEEFSRLFRKRKDVEIRKHFLSHPLKTTLLYNDSIRFFGTRVPLVKYIVNVSYLLSGWNPFRKSTPHGEAADPSRLMTYQYVILQKK